MSEGNSTVCPSTLKITLGARWISNKFEVNDLSVYVLPALLMQFLIILIAKSSTTAITSSLGFPTIFADLIGITILLSPTIIGKVMVAENSTSLQSFIFPFNSYLLLEFIGSMGLIFYTFLVALQFDFKMIVTNRKKVTAIATTSIILPLLITSAAISVIGLSAPMANSSFEASRTEQIEFVLLLGLALSTTAFPILARFLEEEKIPDAEISSAVLPSALLGNVEAWIATAACFSFTRPANEALAPLRMVLAGACFVLICACVVRPVLKWIDRQTLKGQFVQQEYTAMVIVLVLISWLVSKTIGFHPIFGSLVVGLLVPKGPLSKALIEQLDYIVIGFLLPFQIVGVDHPVDLISIVTPHGNEPSYFVARLFCVMVIAMLAKVAGGMIIAASFSMSYSQGLSIGVLMSTTGPMQMMILNTGKKENVFNEKICAMFVVGSVISIIMASSLASALNKRSQPAAAAYEQRNLLQLGPDSELRMVACIHTVRNVPSIISFLQLSNRSSLTVYAVHLLEVSNNNPPMLIVHDSHDMMRGGYSLTSGDGAAPSDQTNYDSEIIVSALQRYKHSHGSNLKITCLTSISTYAAMSNDICHIAEDHRATLIVLPFHMVLQADGGMEEIDPRVRPVNQDIMAGGPCSVAILVDRGLGEIGNVNQSIAVLFFGGPDDREALMCAARLAGQDGVELTVVRFLANSEAPSSSAAMTSSRADQLLDNEYVRGFQLQFASSPSVSYTENFVTDGEETVAAIRSLESMYSLYLVGKASGGKSPLLAGMEQFMEFSELGPIGDYLVSADFSDTASVLVVRQYTGAWREPVAEAESRRRRS